MNIFRVYAPVLINSSEETIEQAIPVYGGNVDNPKAYIKYIEIQAEEIGDEYHTMHELYQHRMALFAALCRKEYGWKSKLHSDGTMFDGGYFVAGIYMEKGHQITYHMKIDPWWDRFRVVELERAPEYDGHSPKDVLERLLRLC